MKQTDYYPSSWGLPISYSLRALNGETVVANAGLDELPQRNCILQPKSMNRYTAQITSINTGGDCEMFGIISMQCFVGNQEIVAEEGNGLLTDIAFNQALEQNKIYLPETHSGILGNSRVYKITNPNNTFFRIWTDINDRDVRPNGDDYLFITGGKCGVQVGNRQYCYQDFKVSDLIGRDMGGSGNICAKNKKIVVNSKDNDGDSPLQLQISVCQGY
ncbi:MAG: hypothetical protein KA319_11205 [Ferruginibacter sp.]|nr:hypothetical protein [Ferruginibacter sp.]